MAIFSQLQRHYGKDFLAGTINCSTESMQSFLLSVLVPAAAIGSAQP